MNLIPLFLCSIFGVIAYAGWRGDLGTDRVDKTTALALFMFALGFGVWGGGMLGDGTEVVAEWKVWLVEIPLLGGGLGCLLWFRRTRYLTTELEAAQRRERSLELELEELKAERASSSPTNRLDDPHQ